RSRSQLRHEPGGDAERVPDDRSPDVLHRSPQPEVLTPSRTIPMLRYMNRARWAVAAAVPGLVAVTGCNFKDQLLQPPNPGIIDNSPVRSQAAAAALNTGAMGSIKVVYTSWETLWQEAGHPADEYMNADFQPDRNDVDQRTMATNSPYANYTSITQTRGYIRDAIAAE